ncbi:MAG: hypothetical protein LBS35_13975 [Synergistaceae bacterium]|jgi:hypothetical protein|nr:hypothetical protein [Synergistaceae bacterium]
MKYYERLLGMLCPVGFHETLIFDCRNGKREIIYRDMYISRKEKREELRRESIFMANAVRLAKSAIERNIGQAGFK